MLKKNSEKTPFFRISTDTSIVRKFRISPAKKLSSVFMLISEKTKIVSKVVGKNSTVFKLKFM